MKFSGKNIDKLLKKYKEDFSKKSVNMSSKCGIGKGELREESNKELENSLLRTSSKMKSKGRVKTNSMLRVRNTYHSSK